MVKVIYPITWLAGQEGEAPDVIHDVAVEMMEHRTELLQYSTRIPESECHAYLKQASLLEECATVLNAIYFQLEPERWDPDASEDLLELAQAHNIALPGWMLPERMKPGKARENEQVMETMDEAVNRFDNEGGRVVPQKPISILHRHDPHSQRTVQVM